MNCFKQVLLIIWKSDPPNKRGFLPRCSCVGTTVWMLTKHIEKELEGKYIRMLHAVLNKILEAMFHKKKQSYSH